MSHELSNRALRPTKSLEELLPWLYLKGISTGDFSAALAALLGPEAPGLSASAVARLKELWRGELERWERRDLEAKRYLYIWADGVYFQPRLEDDKPVPENCGRFSGKNRLTSKGLEPFR